MVTVVVVVVAVAVVMYFLILFSHILSFIFGFWTYFQYFRLKNIYISMREVPGEIKSVETNTITTDLISPSFIEM